MQVSVGTVNKDISYLGSQSKQKIRKYIDETLLEEYEKCLVGINAILREAWNTSQNTDNRKEKIQALSLAKECYSMKLELLTNATVVDDAMRFVSEYSNNRKKLVSKQEENNNNQESKEKEESDYNSEDTGLEEEHEEEESVTIRTTTNKVF